MGKLLDHWRTVFLAHRATTGGLDHYTWFHRYHRPDRYRHALLDLLYGRALGYRRSDLWIGCSLPGHVLGNSVILGFCSAFGALVPSIYYDVLNVPGKETFSDLLASTGGRLVLLGVLVCLTGIFISGRAGMMKENELPDDQKQASVKEFALTKGLIVAVISGILSACFSFGLEAGSDMAMEANRRWVETNPGQGEFLFRNNVTYVVLLWGGLTTNFIWCMILNTRNKSFGDYVNNKTPLLRNYLFSALAGTTWFLQFFFMVWVKAKWVTRPAAGFCIWHSSYWWPICGALC